MKKCNLLILAIIAVAIIYSCKKEPFHNPSMENHQQIYTAEELSVWKKLNDFNRLIKSSEKSGESVSADSAVWLMEALFNATETSREPFDDFYTDSAFYTIPLNADGNASVDDVSEVYNTMVADFQTRLAAFDETHKIIVLGDLVNIGNAKSGDLHVVVSRGFGLNYIGVYDTFNLAWYWGNMLGTCGGDSIGDSDGGEELEIRFNHPKIHYTEPHDSTHLVANSIVQKIANFDEYPTYKFNIKWPEFDTCISYDSLNSFLTKGHNQIIYKYADTTSNSGERPIGKDFYYLDVTSTPKGAINVDSVYQHCYTIFYANFINIPPIEED